MSNVTRCALLVAVAALAGCGSHTTPAARDRAVADRFLQALAANDHATADKLYTPRGETPVSTRVTLAHTDPKTVAALGRQVDCGRDANLSPEVTGRCYRYCLPGSLTLDGDPYPALEVTVTRGRVTAYLTARC
jgi:hypothetical protein